MRTSSHIGHVGGLAIAGVTFVLATGAAFADDVKVKVKRGDLVVSGAAGGRPSVTVVPTATGLRLEPQNETTINGSADPFETSEVTRDWKIRLGKTRRLAFRTERPAQGIPALQPRRVVLTAGRRAEIDLIGVEVGGDVKIDMGRARDGICVNVFESSVGGSFKAKLGIRGDALDVTIQSTDISESLKLFGHAQNPTAGRAERFVVSDCNIGGGFVLKTAILSSEVDFKRNQVGGNALFKADMFLEIDDVQFAGDLALRSNLRQQRLMLDAVSVAGKTTIVTGTDDDSISITDCGLQKLTVRTGKGADALETIGSGFDATSVYDGSSGNDSWVTDGPTDALRTLRVETITEQQPQ